MPGHKLYTKGEKGVLMRAVLRIRIASSYMYPFELPQKKLDLVYLLVGANHSHVTSLCSLHKELKMRLEASMTPRKD